MYAAYKEYEIKPTSVQFRENNMWEEAVYIVKHHGDHSNERRYSSGKSFQTKQKVEDHAIEFGKQVIDGQCQGLSVDDL